MSSTALEIAVANSIHSDQVEKGDMYDADDHVGK